MNLINTSAECFSHLPGYSFQANYINVGPTQISDKLGKSYSFDHIQMHYVDFGPKHAPVIVMLHGIPAWSYVYRDMIYHAIEAGFRVIAPDLIGFGKSDKFDSDDAYTLSNAVSWIGQLISNLQLKDFDLVCQNSISMLAIALSADHSESIRKLVFINPFNADNPLNSQELSSAHMDTSSVTAGDVIQNSTRTDLIKEIVSAYDAPYVGGNIKVDNLMRMHSDEECLLHIQENSKLHATLLKLNVPMLLVVSSQNDDSLNENEDKLRKVLPSCSLVESIHIEINSGFPQEDCSISITQHILRFLMAPQFIQRRSVLEL